MGEVLTAVVHAGEDWFRTRETKKEQRWQRRVSTALYPLPEQELLSQYAEAFTNLARLFETLPCQKERPGDEALSKVVVQVRQISVPGVKMRSSAGRRTIFPAVRHGTSCG